MPSAFAQVSDATVAVEGGKIQGVAGDVPGVTVYKAIPFAAPPVGPNRWKAPQPVVAWSGVKESSAWPNRCYQLANANPPGAAVSKDVAVAPDEEPAPPLTAADAPPMYTYDPWERLNRSTYRFNARFDDALFLPMVNVYKRVPSPLRTGVHNFFGNLSEVDSVVKAKEDELMAL